MTHATHVSASGWLAGLFARTTLDCAIGTIAEYYAAKDESQRFKLRLLDQRVRQETKAKASIQKAQQRAQQQARKGGKKHVNEKAQKQVGLCSCSKEMWSLRAAWLLRCDSCRSRVCFGACFVS